MTLIIDMASGTEYQGDDLRCQTRQQVSTTHTNTPDDYKQTVPGLQLVETTNDNDKPETVAYIDMHALFESNSS